MESSAASGAFRLKVSEVQRKGIFDRLPGAQEESQSVFEMDETGVIGFVFGDLGLVLKKTIQNM